MGHTIRGKEKKHSYHKTVQQETKQRLQCHTYHRVTYELPPKKNDLNSRIRTSNEKVERNHFKHQVDRQQLRPQRSKIITTKVNQEQQNFGYRTVLPRQKPYEKNTKQQQTNQLPLPH